MVKKLWRCVKQTQMDRQTELLYQLSMLTRNKNQTSKNTNITQDITIVQWESLVAMACPAVRPCTFFVVSDYRSKWGEFCSILSKFRTKIFNKPEVFKIPNWELRLPHFPRIPDREFSMALALISVSLASE